MCSSTAGEQICYCPYLTQKSHRLLLCCLYKLALASGLNALMITIVINYAFARKVNPPLKVIIFMFNSSLCLEAANIQYLHWKQTLYVKQKKEDFLSQIKLMYRNCSVWYSFRDNSDERVRSSKSIHKHFSHMQVCFNLTRNTFFFLLM